jgi:hypothetical protein
MSDLPPTIETNHQRKGKNNMSRGKAISVKIPTQRVITALETKLAELEANYKTQDENEAKYQQAYKLGKKKLVNGLLLISQRQRTFAQTIALGTRLSMLILTSSQRKVLSQ